MIYFDNAATTLPKPDCVATAIINAINTFGNPSRGSHEAALNGLRCLMQTREEIADYFGLEDSRGVVFMQNATMALNTIISDIKGHIVTTAAEHNSVLRPIYRKNNITIVPLNRCGELDLNELERAIQPETEAIIMTHASNVTGNVYDIEAVGRICSQRNIKFIVDAAQTAGLLSIDMGKCGITALCFSGHKSLYGPQGTGGMCIRPDSIPKSLMVGGSGMDSFSMEHPSELPDALEAGTQNSHGIAGLQQGLCYIRQMNGACYSEADKLAKYFISKIRDKQNMIIYGNIDAPIRTPVVALNIVGMDSADLSYLLQNKYGIAVRSGIHCAPLMHKALGTEETGVVRFSFSHFNTLEEVDVAVAALGKI